MKPGEGGNDDLIGVHRGNLLWSPAGSQPRPAKVDRQPEASLAQRGAIPGVKRRQRMHGPCDGAPKVYRWRRRTLFKWRKATPKRCMDLALGSAGVEEQGTCMEDSPGTREVRTSPPRDTGTGFRSTQAPGPWPLRSVATGSGRRDAAEVPLSEGDEARRDGRSEVGAAHSTDESGEPAPRDPVKGRGGRVMEP